MKLKHYVYEFGEYFHKENAPIFVVINGVTTSIKIQDLFEGKSYIDNNDITGYSILQLLKGGNILIDENNILDITFISDKPFSISAIRRPFMYNNDVELTDEKRLIYTDLLLNAIRPAIPLSEGGNESNKGVAEVESPASSLVSWNLIEQDLQDKGFTLINYGPYKYFYKENEIAFFEVSEKGFKDIDLFEEGDNVYSFRGTDFKEYELSFKNNKLKIKQLI